MRVKSSGWRHNGRRSVQTSRRAGVWVGGGHLRRWMSWPSTGYESRRKSCTTISIGRETLGISHHYLRYPRCSCKTEVPEGSMAITHAASNCAVWNGKLQSFTCDRIYNIYWFSFGVTDLVKIVNSLGRINTKWIPPPPKSISYAL